MEKLVIDYSSYMKNFYKEELIKKEKNTQYCVKNNPESWYHREVKIIKAKMASNVNFGNFNSLEESKIPQCLIAKFHDDLLFSVVDGSQRIGIVTVRFEASQLRKLEKYLITESQAKAKGLVEMEAMDSHYRDLRSWITNIYLKPEKLLFESNGSVGCKSGMWWSYS